MIVMCKIKKVFSITYIGIFLLMSFGLFVQHNDNKMLSIIEVNTKTKEFNDYLLVTHTRLRKLVSLNGVTEDVLVRESIKRESIKISNEFDIKLSDIKHIHYVYKTGDVDMNGMYIVWIGLGLMVIAIGCEISYI